MPKRTSFPSMFPPGFVAVLARSMPRAAWMGWPRASAQYAVVTPPKNSTNIAAHTAQPCFWLFTIRPSMYVNADGIMKIVNIDQQFVHGVGLSHGCDAFE